MTLINIIFQQAYFNFNLFKNSNYNLISRFKSSCSLPLQDIFQNNLNKMPKSINELDNNKLKILIIKRQLGRVVKAKD